jgi:predicted lipoprotein with Yx(FWY)xxD motif
MTRALPLAGICVALALGACGSDDEDDPAPASEQATTNVQATEDGSGTGESGDQAGDPRDRQRERPPGIEITTADSQFGEILFDADRRAIYLFDKETGPRSECYGECAAAWPPVLTKGEPEASGAVEGKLLGTTKRDDGTTQVTYDGQPLYYYVDEPRGQVLCHNVDEFGGLWLVVQPSGDPVA